MKMAFPQEYRVPGCSTIVGETGLTKREWYAGMGLAGVYQATDPEATFDDIAIRAVKQADALIDALKEKPE